MAPIIALWHYLVANFSAHRSKFQVKLIHFDNILFLFVFGLEKCQVIRDQLYRPTSSYQGVLKMCNKSNCAIGIFQGQKFNFLVALHRHGAVGWAR